MTSRKQQSLKVLGHKIRLARKSIGLSQKDLAKFLKITDKAISSYEVGRTSPPIFILKKISTIVHKPLGYFDGEATLSREELMTKLRTIEEELKEIKRFLRKEQV